MCSAPSRPSGFVKARHLGESGSDKQHGLTGPMQMNFNAFHTIHSTRRFSHLGPPSFTMTVQMLAASKQAALQWRVVGVDEVPWGFRLYRRVHHTGECIC